MSEDGQERPHVVTEAECREWERVVGHSLAMTGAEFEEWEARQRSSLAIIESKSKCLSLEDRVQSARVQAGRNVAWAKHRRVVDRATGECISTGDGDDHQALSLADVGASWYTEAGCRRQLSYSCKRMEKSGAFGSRFAPVFLRLSVDAKKVPGGTKEAAWEVSGAQLNRMWSNLRGYCKRRGHDIAYFWVREAHPDPSKPHYGWPHFHIVILGMPFIPWKLLERWWGLGLIDVRVARAEDQNQLVKYLGKYAWKSSRLLAEHGGDLSALPDWWFYYRVFHCRRFGFSQFFHWQGLERVPGWVAATVVYECGIAAELVTKAERAPGGGWCVSYESPGQPGEEFVLVLRSPWVMREV